MSQLLQQLAGDADDLVDGLDHVYGDADGPGLVRNGAGGRLAYPPGGIGGELVALGVVELVHGLDKAEVALLDEVCLLYTSYIAKNKIKLVMINAIDLAQQIGMGKRTNTILQLSLIHI